MSSYRVRDARASEADRIVDIVEAILQESPTYACMAFDRKKAKNTLANGILKHEGWFLRVIVDSKDIVVGGICGLCIPSDFGPDKTAFDITMMIEKSHRGRCTRQFVQCCEEFKAWALTEGAKVIKLGVSSGIKIDSVSNLLERLGYVRIGAMHAYMVGDAT